MILPFLVLQLVLLEKSFNFLYLTLCIHFCSTLCETIKADQTKLAEYKLQLSSLEMKKDVTA